MDLTDGLREYQNDSSYWRLTVELEVFAKEIVASLSRHGDNPPKRSLSRSKDFLLKVEQWKAMCIEDQTGMASKNAEVLIWEAFQGALRAGNDVEAVRSIMSLVGFGSQPDKETGLGRAKRATAVLRFMKPTEWGVVDWRTAATLGLFKKHNGDINSLLIQAETMNPKDLRKCYDIIDEHCACQINKEYRVMRTEELPRAADVDMALFGISLKAWPRRKSSNRFS